MKMKIKTKLKDLQVGDWVCLVNPDHVRFGPYPIPINQPVRISCATKTILEIKGGEEFRRCSGAPVYMHSRAYIRPFKDEKEFKQCSLEYRKYLKANQIRDSHL